MLMFEGIKFKICGIFPKLEILNRVLNSFTFQETLSILN